MNLYRLYLSFKWTFYHIELDKHWSYVEKALKFPTLSWKVSFLSIFLWSFLTVKLLQATDNTESQKERAQSASLTPRS